MSSAVRLASLGTGVLQDASGNVITNRSIRVYTRDTTSVVPVYTDETLTTPLTQPLTTDSTGAVPGWVASGQSIDFYDTLSGGRIQGEALAAVSVANGASLPSFAGSVLKALGTTSGQGGWVPDVVVDAHRYGKGDSSQDELANLQAAIGEVQARQAATGGAFGVVDLGYGIWKISNTLVLPSNVGLISQNALGHQAPGAQIEPWAGFPDQVGMYLLATASESTTVASGSNGVAVSSFAGSGVLNVGSTAGFPTSGQVFIATSTGYENIFYTGVTSTSFTGCTANDGLGGNLFTGGFVGAQATNNCLDGIGTFVNSSFQNVGGVIWNSSYGYVTRSHFANNPWMGFILNGPANQITFNFSEGGKSRSTNSSTVNGTGQTFPSSTTLTVASTTGWPTTGAVQIAGVVGDVLYTNISGNQLTGCTGGQGTATNGGAVNRVVYPTLTQFTGLGFHVAVQAADNTIIANEFAGAGNSGSALQTAAGWHCAALNDGGGPARWLCNLLESSDTSLYINAKYQIVTANRIEWSNGPGLQTNLQAARCYFQSNAYHNNGLGQNDTYCHIYNGIPPNYSASNAFAGEKFTRDTATASGSYNAAAAIFDLSNGVGNLNYYADLLIDSTAWVSQPWVLPSQPLANRAELRSACQQWGRFVTTPTTGTFITGETYGVNGAFGARTVVEIAVTGSGTLGTLSGVTATTTSGQQTVQLNAGKGASVPLGSFLTITGCTFAAGSGSLIGNQVIAKNGDTLTMAGTANATVSSAATSFQGVGTRNLMSVPQVSAVALTTPSITTGQNATQTASVTSATLGDQVFINYNQDTKGCTLYGWVSASGTVSWFWSNGTGSTQSLASGSVQITVKPAFS